MALKPLNSVGGFSVGEIPANVILSNADIISNNLTVQKVANLGPVGNVIITGGSANQYLQTDGFGNLTWTTADTSRILNGTSNVSIPTANGNVNTSVGGIANVFVVTTTGANVTGTFSASGNLDAANANLGNLVTANFANFSNDLVVQGNIANANNISVTNNLNAVVGNFSGNINSLNANLGNLAQANFVNVASNVTASNVTVNLELSGNTANFTGNISASNANLGNLASANYVNVSQQLNGNVANFSGNLTSQNANLGNLATANFVNVSTNVNVTNTMEAGNVRTDNLLHANGDPWDFQQPAGSNTQIQFNDGAGGFGASSNLTFNTATNILTVTGNANVTGAVNTANINSGTSDLVLTANGQNATFSAASGNFTFPGNVIAGTFYGNVNANVSISAANTSVLFSDAGLIAGASGFTFDKASNLFSTPGNLDVADDLNVTGVAIIDSNVQIAAGNISDLSGSGIELYSNNYSQLNYNGENYVYVDSTGAKLEANSFVAHLDTAGDFSLPNNLSVVGNIANANNISVTNALDANTGNFSGNITSLNANLGNLVEANYVNVASNVITGNLTVNLELAGNTANFSGNVIVPNLSVNLELAGNTANFSGNVVVPNLSVNLELAGNTANFTGNISAANANLGNLVQANYVNVANNLTTLDANVTGTLTVANANISSNLTVNNLTVNLELSGNTANLIGNVVLSGAQVTVNNHLAGNTANFSGNIVAQNANLGNIVDANYIRTQELYNGNSNVRIDANGNVTVSLTGTGNVITFSNAGVNVVGHVEANGNGTFGALYSNTLTAQGGNLTIYAAAGDNYVEIRPSGNGQIDVGNHRIQSLATPVASTDAATKGYVDAAVEGLHIHAPCVAATPDTLANISVGTVTYNNGNAGVGATLVTTGSYTLIDGVNIATVGTRILVKDEANAAHNGIYTYTDSTTLTRATDFNTPTEMAGGDFTFVQQGTIYNDTGWVMTDPVVTVGTSPVVWLQFSGAGEYSAGAGLTLTGTVFSVNVDNITTEIAGGNVVVKANAQLTTPNIGAATGTSLDLTGNLLAGNVNSNALVSAANVNVTANVLAGNLTANANLLVNNATVNLELSGNTANFSGNVVVPNLQVNLSLAGNTANFTGNISAANANLGNLVQANYVNVANNLTTLDANVTGTLTVANANIGGNVVVNNLTVNLELSGNTANFSGNVVVPNLTVNTTLSGNVANFTGNLTAANGNLGNLVTANFANIASNTITSNLTVNLELAGNTANFSGNIVAGNISTSGSGGNITGANVVSANTFSGNLQATFANATGNITGGNLVTAGVANVAQLNVTGNVTSDLLPNANLSHDLGNATLRWDNVYAGNIDASGNLTIGGNLSSNNYTANIITANVQVNVGNTNIRHAEVTTTSITANQAISTVAVSGITGIEWIVKGLDSAGSGKYSMAIVTAVTDGSTVDYSTFGGVTLGSPTGSLAVNIVGSNVELQVTPSSSNSTVWITQYRTI